LVQFSLDISAGVGELLTLLLQFVSLLGSYTQSADLLTLGIQLNFIGRQLRRLILHLGLKRDHFVLAIQEILFGGLEMSRERRDGFIFGGCELIHLTLLLCLQTLHLRLVIPNTLLQLRINLCHLLSVILLEGEYFLGVGLFHVYHFLLSLGDSLLP
jgi:hypothetical protein